jgi:hypothetical protein
MPVSGFFRSKRPGMGLACAIVMGPGAQPGALTAVYEMIVHNKEG